MSNHPFDEKPFKVISGHAMKLEQRDYADCVDELRQQSAEWADQGCIHTADVLRRAADELETLRRESAALSPLYEALRGLMAAFDACAMIYDKEHETAYIAAREAIRKAEGA
jgi:acyl-CoA reductase-like NAD-dependent aldehyde dehydrogenase